MNSIAPHIPPLPDELVPKVPSNELIGQHVERLRDAGVAQHTVADELGFQRNFVSMLKSTQRLALPRVLSFSEAAGLTAAERSELLHTRLMELHGKKGEFSVECLAEWGRDQFSPAGDEAVLVQLWQKAASPAPQLVAGLLDNQELRQRVLCLLSELVQAELARHASEAAEMAAA